MNSERSVDTGTVAKFLLLSPRRVRQLANEGVLEKLPGQDGEPLRGRFNLLACVNAYVRYLRSQSKLADPDQYAQARALRMAALAEIEQLRLKRIHGKLHHASHVEFVMTQMLTALKSRLLAIPSRACHGLQGKTDLVEISQLLTDEIESALRELSDYDPAKFESANEEYLASIGAAKPGAEAGQ